MGWVSLPFFPTALGKCIRVSTLALIPTHAEKWRRGMRQSWKAKRSRPEIRRGPLGPGGSSDLSTLVILGRSLMSVN